jgi:uncharacterized membrane protein YeaQ/YmgE (transglycosylase-associated protein family)
MNFVYLIIFGLITGTVANFLIPGTRGGIVKSIIFGILGTMAGDYLGERFYHMSVTGFNLQSFLVAICGSLVLIVIAKLF